MNVSIAVFCRLCCVLTMAGALFAGCAHQCCGYPDLVYYQGDQGVPPKHDVAFVAPIVDVPTIYFALDSHKLDTEAQAKVALVAGELREHPYASVLVHGHTCDLASDEYNLNLGAERAAAVRAFLIAQGVQERQIEIDTHGESMPDAPNQPGLRPLNRRAEFSIDIDERY
jgi:outer membrane protein OmpA-like peptidoglycan-associated protein